MDSSGINSCKYCISNCRKILVSLFFYFFILIVFVFRSIFKGKKIKKNMDKEVKQAKKAVKKAKKEIREAEETTEKAQEEVVEAAEVIKGKQKHKFIGAARDLEKAVHSAAESCEAIEEADFKIKNK